MPPKKKNPILRRFHGSVADTLLQLLPAVRLQRSLLLSCSERAGRGMSSGPRHHAAPDDGTLLPGSGSGGGRQAASIAYGSPRCGSD